MGAVWRFLDCLVPSHTASRSGRRGPKRVVLVGKPSLPPPLLLWERLLPISFHLSPLLCGPNILVSRSDWFEGHLEKGVGCRMSG